MPPSTDRNLRQAEYFANRLSRNASTLRKWAAKNDIHALRLYDRDIPEIPLAVERFDDGQESALVISLYQRPYDKPEDEETLWMKLMAKTASDTLGVAENRIFLKTRKHMKGLEQYGRTGDTAFVMTVRECGLAFLLNLSEHLDSGLFLDHRPARQAVRSASRGKRVLNLFSYTGSFSVNASKGAALDVTSVDLSNTYLAWTRKNFELNDLSACAHEEIRSDVMEYLDREAGLKRRWDIIIADPPTFSNSTMAKEDFDVNRDWPRLLLACSTVLAPGGTILFSTNSRLLRWEPEKTTLPWKDVSDKSIPRDFRNRRVHSCWVLGEHTVLELTLENFDLDNSRESMYL